VEVGQKIKKYLQDNNIQQNNLSVTTKIAMPKLNLALNGKRRLKFEEYEIICYCLGVGVDKFMEPHKPSNRRKGD
jgi:transcriptional regulator with XRE-family HTH domain